MDNIATPMIILALVGGVVSHLLARRRLHREQQKLFRLHTTALTAVADAAIEVMAIDAGMDIRTAQKRLMEEAQKRVPSLMGFPAQATEAAMAKAQAYVDKKRAERGLSNDKKD